MAEDAGISLVTVHGRSRACKFKGNVHYDRIAEVVEAVQIPVVANGDISSESEALCVLEQTGAAAVMVAALPRVAPGCPARSIFS